MRLEGSVLAVCLVAAVAVSAQSMRGEAAPAGQPPIRVEIVRLRFLAFTFGREGPMEMPLRGAPVAGREYFVEADLSGIESVASIRFELVDTSGRPLQTLTMWKSTDGWSDGEFNGLVTVPGQAFRPVIAGTTIDGASFRAAGDDLVHPVGTGPASDVVVPPGLAVDEMRQVDEMVSGYRQQWKARAARARSDHRDGIIVFARPAVSAIAYEPFLSAAGTPLGLRLRYSVRVPTRQVLTVVPHVVPMFGTTAWRGVVRMAPLSGTVMPAPTLVGAQSMQDVIRYQTAATYEAGVSYTFTIDFVPDYVLQGQSGRFCLYLQKFSDRTVFDAMLGSTESVPYLVTIADTDTSATITAFLPQRTFYESFVRLGSSDCGPTPSLRF